MSFSGARVAELNKLHEKHRINHCGIAPPRLPTNWMTISEVVRLNLITSGYCPMGAVYPLRATKRGGIQCYQDPVYLHLLDDSSLTDKLETVNIISHSYFKQCVTFRCLYLISLWRSV